MSNLVERILDTGMCPHDMSVAEYMKNRYEHIGKYILDHAEELSNGITENVRSAELKVFIPANDLVTLEHKIDYYVLERK